MLEDTKIIKGQFVFRSGYRTRDGQPVLTWWWSYMSKGWVVDVYDSKIGRVDHYRENPAYYNGRGGTKGARA